MRTDVAELEVREALVRAESEALEAYMALRRHHDALPPGVARNRVGAAVNLAGEGLTSIRHARKALP